MPCGAHVPYVIRRRPARRGADGAAVDRGLWTVIGEAYVHSVMFGELKLGEKEEGIRVFWLT